MDAVSNPHTGKQATPAHWKVPHACLPGCTRPASAHGNVRHHPRQNAAALPQLRRTNMQPANQGVRLDHGALQNWRRTPTDMSKTERRGFSIRIFLADGSPDGLKIVEKSNWTGKGVVWPRALFGDAKKRAEFQKTGVDLLLGSGTESGLPQAYLGEGDPLRAAPRTIRGKKGFLDNGPSLSQQRRKLEQSACAVSRIAAAAAGV